uniref:PDZ domain-containing protein GIPC1 n=1 Tax=Caligus clemensi TaxID=344056 RepID=C1C1V8_CALCM|nr:PDZ domain-containing protein GIPC1 [Caligus clemensi]
MWKGRSRATKTEAYEHERDSPDSGLSEETPANRSPSAHKPKLTFHCQQAQGSPTGIISGFTNVKELYQKIAEVYEIAASEILFCTLNTYKVDMAKLLGGQIGLDDFIFAHRKGQPKEVEITKTQDALGLTITDNGSGYAFIKRIKDGSIISQISYISVGDHIEKIDDESLVGSRHFEVAKKLKEIPKGKTFVLRLVEPLKAGFSNAGPKSSNGSSKKGYGTGKQTLRFKSNGSAQVEEIDDARTLAEEKINEVLEVFMGINDLELASQIWDLASSSNNTMDFAEAIDNSSLEPFGFTDDFIFELWGIVTDARSGRLKKSKH